MRKASGRPQQAVVVSYGGHAADAWWNRNAAALARLKNLTVIHIAAADVDAIATLFDRSRRLTAMIQDGELQLMVSGAPPRCVPKCGRAGQATHSQRQGGWSSKVNF